MAIDLDFSYELDGFEFGRGTNFHVAQAQFEPGALTTHDAPLPRVDGISFGRDYRSGQIISFTGNILTNRVAPGDIQAAPAEQAAMEAAWDREDIRLVPGRVLPLRMQRNGRRRRVYGRPRRFAATSGSTSRGWIPFAADFQCVDSLFYDDLESTRYISLIPPETGGLFGDLIGDWIATGAGNGNNTVEIAGSKPSWLIMQIRGPIQNPSIEVVGQWKVQLNYTIPYDDSVIIDPQPWSRSVRRASDGANLTGKFTASSPRLSSMRVPPGQQQVILRGIDSTGSAGATVRWRDTFGSF